MGTMGKHNYNSVCHAFNREHSKVLRKHHSLGEGNASEGTSERSLKGEKFEQFHVRGCTNNNHKTQKII